MKDRKCDHRVAALSVTLGELVDRGALGGKCEVSDEASDNGTGGLLDHAGQQRLCKERATSEGSISHRYEKV